MCEDWGCDHCKEYVVTDDTIDCLIALSLDFPIMSVSNYTNYLNFKYGPNHANKISLSTVYSVLNKLNFNRKKAYFAPQNRNSVGMRIYRYAWCRFIKEL